MNKKLIGMCHGEPVYSGEKFCYSEPFPQINCKAGLRARELQSKLDDIQGDNTSMEQKLKLIDKLINQSNSNETTRRQRQDRTNKRTIKSKPNPKRKAQRD